MRYYGSGGSYGSSGTPRYNPQPPSWPRRVADWLFVSLTLAVSLFYYSTPLQAIFQAISQNLQWPQGQQIAEALANFRSTILLHSPEFRGLKMFGHTLFSMQISPHFMANLWPIIGVTLGILMQFAIGRFVTNWTLKELSSENWIVLTTYLVLALEFSVFFNWNFLAIIIFSGVTVVVLVGAYQILTILLSGIRNTIYIIRRFLGVFLMNLAAIGAYVSDALSHLYEAVTQLLKLMVVPFTALYEWLDRLLSNLESDAQHSLDHVQNSQSPAFPGGACLVVATFITVCTAIALLTILRIR